MAPLPIIIKIDQVQGSSSIWTGIVSHSSEGALRPLQLDKVTSRLRYPATRHPCRAVTLLSCRRAKGENGCFLAPHTLFISGASVFEATFSIK